MQLAAVPQLLLPPAIARGTPYDAARAVQGRPLVRLGQQGDPILVNRLLLVHAALGDINRAHHMTARGAPTAA